MKRGPTAFSSLQDIYDYRLKENALIWGANRLNGSNVLTISARNPSVYKVKKPKKKAKKKASSKKQVKMPEYLIYTPSPKPYPGMDFEPAYAAMIFNNFESNCAVETQHEQRRKATRNNIEQSGLFALKPAKFEYPSIETIKALNSNSLPSETLSKDEKKKRLRLVKNDENMYKKAIAACMLWRQSLTFSVALYLYDSVSVGLLLQNSAPFLIDLHMIYSESTYD